MELDWDTLDTRGKCMALQESLIQASLLTTTKPAPKKSKYYGSKSTNKLRSRGLQLEAVVNRLEQEKHQAVLSVKDEHLLKFNLT